MSFDVNPLNDYTPPSIKTNKTSDGGAGSLGYFKQEEKRKEQEEELEKSIFKETKDSYSFSIKDAEDSYYGDIPLTLKIINAIKAFIQKLLNK